MSNCNETDPEIFFPSKGESTRPAKELCYTCPDMGECLQTVDLYEGNGVIAGMDTKGRKSLRKYAPGLLKYVEYGTD